MCPACSHGIVGVVSSSVHMARRVLQLERTNALLKKNVDKGELKIDQLSHQVRICSTMMYEYVS